MSTEPKKEPRKIALRIELTAYVPSEIGDVMDKIITEKTLGITDNTLPSKIMAEIKPQLIDTLTEARNHKTSSIITAEPKSLIIP